MYIHIIYILFLHFHCHSPKSAFLYIYNTVFLQIVIQFYPVHQVHNAITFQIQTLTMEKSKISISYQYTIYTAKINFLKVFYKVYVKTVPIFFLFQIILIQSSLFLTIIFCIVYEFSQILFIFSKIMLPFFVLFFVFKGYCCIKFFKNVFFVQCYYIVQSHVWIQIFFCGGSVE